MSHVFHRVLNRELPKAVRAEGAWIEDVDGRRYLDGAGGAIVVNVGHGDRRLVEAMAAQAGRVDYVHGTMFTTESLESYANELAPLLPMDEPRIYPVSGGSEAVETAIKLARTYHLARGEDRTVVIGRRASYHGNSLGALDAGGKETLRRPYAPWLGRFAHVDAAYEYRCTMPDHPKRCGAQHAEALDRTIREIGADKVTAFIAEPVVGATLGAAVPTDDYWPAVVGICRNHDVLLIADEVMTGFGRTGRWFGMDHWGVRPDIITCGKGSTSGYWPFGFTAASGPVFDTVRPKGFVHGFTWSHNGVGAAVAHAALRALRDGDLVEASRAKGELLLEELSSAFADSPIVGDVRGIGLMVGIELVADRASKAPFPRSDRVTERVVAAARDRGLLLYSSTGHADGVNGDLVMLGPPFVISDEERALLVERTEAAVAAVAGV
ncbi:MAG: aminotransferase class III-fold pyridoxal phosphate-dependent enzyme [Actinomycetota bacterium]